MSGQSGSTDHGATASIRLFWVNLDETAKTVDDLENSLAPDELRRASRLREARLRSRWMAARRALRHLLGAELDRAPGKVRLQTTERGKPYLEGGELAFNLSHSGPHLLIALAPVGRVGVDVECIRPLPELAGLVERHFTGAEAQAILSAADLPEDDDTFPAFFRTWVRKEALLKAVGLGVSTPLDTFQVTTAPEPSHRTNLLLRNDLPGEGDVPWQVRSIPAPSGAVAALAWDTPELTVVEGSLQMERSV